MVGSQSHNIDFTPKINEGPQDEESEEEQNEGGEENDQNQQDGEEIKEESKNDPEPFKDLGEEAPKQNSDEEGSEYTEESEESEIEEDEKKQDMSHENSATPSSPVKKSLFSNLNRDEDQSIDESSREEATESFDFTKDPNFDTELYNSCVLEDMDDLERVRFMLVNYSEKLLCNVLNQLFNEDEYEL